MMTTAAPNADASQPSRRQPIADRLAEVLLIVLVFFVVAGDLPPAVNEAHYLSRLKHYWNPTWCRGDFFLESPDTQLVFIWMLGGATRWLSLAATAWIGRVLAWTLLAWAWQRLSWRLVPMRLASVLSATLIVTLNGQAHLAGEWVVGGVEAKCFAYGFVVLALRDVVDRRWDMACLMLGAATAFHPLVGGWSAVVCTGLWLLEKVKGDWSIFAAQRSPTSVDRIKNGPVPFYGLVVGALVSLIGIVPALLLTWNEPADLVAEASRIYVFERLPHHLALLALPREELTRRLVGHAVLLVWLAGLTGALRRHLTRRVIQFAWGAALLAGVGLAIELMLADKPLLAAQLQRYYWYRLTDFAAPMAAALGLTVVISNVILDKKIWATWALFAAALFAAWHPASVAVQRFVLSVPPADLRVADYRAWVDVCDWIARETPAESLFLTPRLNHSFKWRTGRPEVVSRKDIPQDTRGIIEWDRRIKDIYYYEGPAGVEGPIDSLGQLGTKRVHELAQKYGADFVLSDRGQLLSLPRAYWNEEYVVYRTDERTVDAGR
jgi:hypothetical protein